MYVGRECRTPMCSCKGEKLAHWPYVGIELSNQPTNQPLSLPFQSQTERMGRQTSHLVYSLARQRC